MFEEKRSFEQAETLDVVLNRWPDAVAEIKGSSEYAGLKGTVRFYQTQCGVIVAAEIIGLPDAQEVCKNPIFGFHIHEGGQCSGTVNAPFADVGTHYNPNMCGHPYHAGDLPPLFSNNGYAWMSFYTGRVNLNDVIGRSLVIHSMRDDFTSQPSGNSGDKIGCGVIEAI